MINFSPDRPAVFRDAFRVLKRGGRLAISDIVVTTPLPEDVRSNVELHLGCMAGAATIDEVRAPATAATESVNRRIMLAYAFGVRSPVFRLSTHHHRLHSFSLIGNTDFPCFLSRLAGRQTLACRPAARKGSV